ncbi:MAG: DUF424 family protein [Candidatus Micrarchaeota archaeon]
MYLKVHESEKGRIVAVCDEGLIGKVLEEGDKVMDLDKHRGFYVGESAVEKDVRKALSAFSSANIVGNESVAVALEMGLADKSDVMYIKKTPYIQIYRL